MYMAYVGRGLSAIREANENNLAYLKLKDGESTVIRILTPLDEIISVYEHTEEFNGNWRNLTCLGKDNCPLCKAGKKASFKSYITVFDKKDGKVKIFKASKTVGGQLLNLVEEYGDLTKRDFKIKRDGEKLKTTYHFFARDPESFDASELDIPDIEELVAPKTPEEILAMMNEEVKDVDVDTVEDDDDYPF